MPRRVAFSLVVAGLLVARGGSPTTWRRLAATRRDEEAVERVAV